MRETLDSLGWYNDYANHLKKLSSNDQEKYQQDPIFSSTIASQFIKEKITETLTNKETSKSEKVQLIRRLLLGRDLISKKIPRRYDFVLALYKQGIASNLPTLLREILVTTKDIETIKYLLSFYTAHFTGATHDQNNTTLLFQSLLTSFNNDTIKLEHFLTISKELQHHTLQLFKTACQLTHTPMNWQYDGAVLQESTANGPQLFNKTKDPLKFNQAAVDTLLKLIETLPKASEEQSKAKLTAFQALIKLLDGATTSKAELAKLIPVINKMADQCTTSALSFG